MKRKLIKIGVYLSVLTVLTGIFACEDDPGLRTQTDVSAKIDALEQDAYLLPQPEEGKDPHLFRITWSKPRLFDDAGRPLYVEGIRYELEADLVDRNFEQATVIARTGDFYADIRTETLRKAFYELAGESTEETQTIALRVKTLAGEKVLLSEPVLIVVTPYVPIKTPPYIYIIGDMNGWDLNNTDYMLYRADNAVENGKYTYTGDFGTGTWLKFCEEKNLGTDLMYGVESPGKLSLSEQTGAFLVEGYATVNIDIHEMTWEIIAVDGSNARKYNGIGPIGDFCGWDNEPWLVNAVGNAHHWYGEFVFDHPTTVKFRGNRDWANNWGTQPTEFPFGVGVFDGPGAAVPAGKYNIYFNDLTGHTVLKQILD